MLTFDKTGEGEAEEKEKTYRSDSSESIPLSRLFLQALYPVLTVSQPATSYAHIVKDNISETAEGPSYKLKAFRDFRLYKYEIT